jgi:thiosulfate dehydrogenase
VKTFILGLIIGAAALAVAIFVYFWTGMAPVATSAGAMPFEKTLANHALHARVKKAMPKTVPIAADEANLAAGAQVYRENCAVCHSLPGQKPTAIAEGEYPKPPKLLQGKGVTDDPPGETYWKVANGIRLTGMPGFDKRLSQTQMWQVSLLLKNAGKLPLPIKQMLSSPEPLPGAVGAEYVPAVKADR